MDPYFTALKLEKQSWLNTTSQEMYQWKCQSAFQQWRNQQIGLSNDHSQNGNQMLLHGQGRSIFHTFPLHPESLELPLSHGDILLGDRRLTPIFEANGYDSRPEDEGSPLVYRYYTRYSNPVTSSPSVSTNSIIHSADEPQMSVTAGRLRTRRQPESPILRCPNPHGRKGSPRCELCRKTRQRCVYASPELPCERCQARGVPCGNKTWPQAKHPRHYPDIVSDLEREHHHNPSSSSATPRAQQQLPTSSPFYIPHNWLPPLPDLE
jgi:hypothetical protein